MGTMWIMALGSNPNPNPDPDPNPNPNPNSNPNPNPNFNPTPDVKLKPKLQKAGLPLTLIDNLNVTLIPAVILSPTLTRIPRT